MPQNNWELVPARVASLVKAAAPLYADLVACALDCDVRHVWYTPATGSVGVVHVPGDDKAVADKAATVLATLPGVKRAAVVYDLPADEHVCVKHAFDFNLRNLTHPIAAAWQQVPSAINQHPNPLVSTLAGSALGAGLGYGGGWLAEKLLPKSVLQRGRLRRTLALLGGLGGAAPGAIWGVQQMMHGPGEGLSAWLTSPFDDNELKHIASTWKEPKSSDSGVAKYANQAGGIFTERIPVDQFNRVIWNDLRIVDVITPEYTEDRYLALGTATDIAFMTTAKVIFIEF